MEGSSRLQFGLPAITMSTYIQSRNNGPCGLLAGATAVLWQAALMEGYTNKVPKVVVGALDNTLILIR